MIQSASSAEREHVSMKVTRKIIEAEISSHMIGKDVFNQLKASVTYFAY